MYKITVKILEDLIKKNFQSTPESIIDFGCGTGIHAVLLTKQGFTVTGLDLSKDQLQYAEQKAIEEELNITWIEGDMSALPELPDTYSLGTSFFGSFCYLQTDSEVLSFLNRSYDLIMEGGILFFEFWNSMALKPGSRHFHEGQKGDVRVLRFSESKFYTETGIVEIPMRHLVYEKSNVIDEFTEVHKLKTYTIPYLKQLINQTNWKIQGIYSIKDEKLVDPTYDDLRYHAVLIKN
jgi:ubiquinone/menaquinone biosynthesis C-methylase UbiE